MKTILLAAALAAVGCGNKDKGSGEGASNAGNGGACATVAKGVDQMMAGGGHAGGAPAPEISERADKLKALYVRHCNEDKWSDEVVACFAGASSMMQIKGCREKLPSEQATTLRNEVLQVMSGVGGMPGGSASPPK
jgi:hypothetical protein